MVDQYYHIIAICLFVQLLLAVTSEATGYGSGASTSGGSSTENAAKAIDALESGPALPENIFQMAFLREYVERSCPQCDVGELVDGVPEMALLGSLMRYMRFEMDLVYARKQVPTFEQYEHVFIDRLLKPCKQTHNLLDEWWTKIYPDRESLGEFKLKWFMVETICRNIISGVESNNLIRSAYATFSQQLDTDYDRQLKDPYWFSSHIDLVAKPIVTRLDRIIQIANIIERLNNPQNTVKLYKAVPTSLLAYGIVNVLATDLNNKCVDLTTFIKEYEWRIQTPCAWADKVLHKWWECRHGELNLTLGEEKWLVIAKICQTILPVPGAQDTSLIELAYRIFHRDL